MLREQTHQGDIYFFFSTFVVTTNFIYLTCNKRSSIGFICLTKGPTIPRIYTSNGFAPSIVYIPTMFQNVDRYNCTHDPARISIPTTFYLLFHYTYINLEYATSYKFPITTYTSIFYNSQIYSSEMSIMTLHPFPFHLKSHLEKSLFRIHKNRVARGTHKLTLRGRFKHMTLYWTSLKPLNDISIFRTSRFLHPAY